MDTSSLIGLRGGKDGTYFEVIAETGRGKTKYYPSIKDGKVLSYPLCGTQAEHDDYFAHKVEQERETIRLTVSGNAICAESAIREATGHLAMAIGPNTVDIYPEEVI